MPGQLAESKTALAGQFAEVTGQLAFLRKNFLGQDVQLVLTISEFVDREPVVPVQ